jgi:hypothetical protein
VNPHKYWQFLLPALGWMPINAIVVAASRLRQSSRRSIYSIRFVSWSMLHFFFIFFNACVFRYYLSKPLTSLNCSLNAVFPGLKMWDTFACATANILSHFIISIVVLEDVPPDAGLQKRDTFSTLNVGLAGPGIKPGPPAWQAAVLTA